ncbi:MAG: hypothetical protein ACXIUV_02745 [Alkalilacustris sp.]
MRLFQLFGRGAAMAALDDALRASGVHPLLVPEAVKLTILRLERRAGRAETALGPAAALLGYCLLGHDAFAEANGADAADAAEARLSAAMEAGGSWDAKLVLLALHAGLLAPEIAARVEAEED